MREGIGCVIKDNHGKWLGGDGRNIGFVGTLIDDISLDVRVVL